MADRACSGAWHRFIEVRLTVQSAAGPPHYDLGVVTTLPSLIRANDDPAFRNITMNVTHFAHYDVPPH